MYCIYKFHNLKEWIKTSAQEKTKPFLRREVKVWRKMRLWLWWNQGGRREFKMWMVLCRAFTCINKQREESFASCLCKFRILHSLQTWTPALCTNFWGEIQGYLGKPEKHNPPKLHIKVSRQVLTYLLTQRIMFLENFHRGFISFIKIDCKISFFLEN